MALRQSLLLPSLKKALLISLFPVTESLLLRFYLRYSEIRVGWGWLVTDYDLGLPCLVGFLFLIYFLEKGTPCRPSLRWKMFFANVSITAVFLILSHLYTNQASTAFKLLWWVSLLAIEISALLVLVPLSYFFKNPNRVAIPFCVLIGLSQVVHQHLFSLFWPVLFPKTGPLSCQVLNGILGHSVHCGFDASDIFRLQHDRFRVFLGPGCSGFDGIFFLTFAFLAFWLMNRKTLPPFRTPAFFLVGLGIMYVLNIFRITSLFLLGILLGEFFQPQIVYKLVLNLFHMNIGWVFYAAGIGIYFHFISNRISMPRKRWKHALEQECA